MTCDADLRRGVLAIARESAATGVALPGEHELARRLQAGRPAVRRVLAELEVPGIVRRHQGAATTVDPVALRMSVRLEEQIEHSVLLDRLGYAPSVEVLQQSSGSLGVALGDVLTQDPAEPVLRARKRWSADGRPAMIADNTLVLPEALPSVIDGIDGIDGIDARRSVFDLAAELWRQPVQWEVATPGVENVADPFASALDMSPGTACMTLTIVGMLRSGARVFHAVERHHPDIVQYSVVRRFPEPWA